MRLEERVARDTSPPTAFIAIFEQLGHRLRLHFPGYQLAFSLTNTLAMSNRVTLSPGLLMIEFDWALIERLVMFSNYFWDLNGERLWRQKTIAWLEQEMLLIAARKSLCTGRFVAARECERLYREYEWDDATWHAVDLGKQAADVAHVVNYLLHVEVARIVAVANPAPIERYFLDRLPSVTEQDLPDFDVMESFMMDGIAIGNVLGVAANNVEVYGFLSEAQLAVTYMSVYRLAAGALHAFEGEPQAILPYVKSQTSVFQGFRLLQVGGLAAGHASAMEPGDLTERMKAIATMSDEFAKVLGHVTQGGLDRLSPYNWRPITSLGSFVGDTTEDLGLAERAEIIARLTADGANDGAAQVPAQDGGV